MTVSLGQILQENQYRLGPQRKMIHFATDPIFTDPHLVNNPDKYRCHRHQYQPRSIILLRTVQPSLKKALHLEVGLFDLVLRTQCQQYRH